LRISYPSQKKHDNQLAKNSFDDREEGLDEKAGIGKLEVGCWMSEKTLILMSLSDLVLLTSDFRLFVVL
jgi:hypothetical protein